MLKPDPTVPAGQLVIGVQQIEVALLRHRVRPGALYFIDIVRNCDLRRPCQQRCHGMIAGAAGKELLDIVLIRVSALPLGQDFRIRERDPDRGKIEFHTASFLFRHSIVSKYSAISRWLRKVLRIWDS